MPATRLLVIADSKMLQALANGLRDGAKFDVLTAPLSDPAAAQAAAEKVDAVALFYGAPGAPLPAALQALSPKVRDRGGRVVAVLQREQAAQRDDCFRAGASDLLFMPMPKDQFVARLQGSVDLSWAAESGAQAPVAVATRTVASKVDRATVSPAGVEAQATLPVKTGDTVRLSWGTFQTWGLVVRPGPTAQIRFAGLAPDEEAQIRDWLKNGAPLARPAPAAAAPSAPAPAPSVAPTPSGGSARVSAPPPTDEMPTPPGGTAAVRAAPTAGPPPGFADRKPIRPQTKTSARVAPPVMSPSGAPPAQPPPAAASTPKAAPASAPRAAPPAAANGAPPLAGIFEESAAPPPAAMPEAAAAAAAVVQGPPWPVPVSAAVCKTVAMHLLKDKTAPPDTPAAVMASARKITGVLSSAERGVLERLGSDSQVANVLAARIALDAATAEGVRLYSNVPAPTVDSNAVTALTKQADEAAAALQKEAGAAIGKGSVESLQMVTAASAALSRDLLNFKETADRLRGIGAAPRLGAGHLDPDLVLPGQAPRPKPLPSTTVQPVKAELRDFQALDTSRPGRWKAILALIGMLGFAAAAFDAFYLSVPHHKDVETEGIAGIVRVDVSGTSALVAVTPEFLARSDSEVPKLAAVLRERNVKKAILVLANGAAAGVIDVTTGKTQGLKKPK